MSYNLSEKIRKIPPHLWILTAIILMGIFLRVYNFHAWLEFKGDQARDAMLVSQVVQGNSPWPLLGPFMTNSATSGGESFHVGPIYYYFQIMAAKIFGDYPDKLAYPDLLFSILTIPLLYYFWRKYFEQNLALGLTGLYAISFFALKYSRFAWNSNSIPFFVLLFLLALYEFQLKKEKVVWQWVILLGVALGIGVQLHVILLIIFSLFTFAFLLFSIVKNKKMWKKWLVVLAIFLLLNAGQIASEIQTNFANSKTFLNYFLHKPTVGEIQEKHPASLFNDFDCHLEANFFMLSSMGEDSCQYYLNNLSTGETTKIFNTFFFRLSLFVSVVFSVLGYVVLGFYCRKEASPAQKQWLQLIAIYLGLAFLIMFPVLKGKIELRYFSFAFFVPFLFLGLFVKYLKARVNKEVALFGATLLFCLVVASNLVSITSITKEFLHKTRIYSNSVVLDELEPIAQYLLANSAEEKIYFSGNPRIINYLYQPLKYLINKQGKQLVPVAEIQIDSFIQNKNTLFFLTNKIDSESNFSYEKVGQKTYVYKLMN